MTDFKDRLERIAAEVELGMNCTLVIQQDQEMIDGRWYFQIACLRPDAFTHKLEMGYGGKAYLSEHASDNELVQTIFGLYKGYWEHEARETFIWRGRRVFGPHISTEALWEVAKRVDLRSAKHVGDQPEAAPEERCAREDRDGRCDLMARPFRLTCLKHARFEKDLMAKALV